MEQGLGTLMVALGANLDPLKKGMLEAQKSMESASARMAASMTPFNEQLKKTGDSLKKVGQDLSMYISLPLAGVGIASFMMGKKFEESMSKIIGLVGIAKEQVDIWAKEFIRLAPIVGQSAGDLAEAMFFITSAGLRGSDAMDALVISAKASTAGLGETKVIADLVTSAMNAYGSAVLSAEKAADILTATVREGKAEASELASSMGSVLPIASEMKVSFDQVGAAIAAMTRTGTDSATASTQLRAILSSLIKPTKQAETALESMGSSSAELRKTIREDGLIVALGKLREMTSQNEEAMGQVIPNIRAMSGVLDLVGANAADNIKIFEALTDTTGALNYAYKTATETVQYTYKSAMDASKSATIAFFDIIRDTAIPLLQTYGSFMQSITKVIQSLTDTQKKWVIGLFSVAVAIGPILMGLGVLTGTLIPLAIKGFLLLTTAVLKLNAAALANPFTAIATAITVAVGAFYIFKSKSEEVLSTHERVSKAASESIAQEIAEMTKYVTIAQSETVTRNQRLAAIKSLQNLAPLIFKNLELEEVNIKAVTEATDKFTIAKQLEIVQLRTAFTEITGQRANYNDQIKTINTLIESTKGVGTVVSSVADAMTRSSSIIENHSTIINSQIIEVNELKAALLDSKTTLEERNAIYKRLAEISPTTLKNLQDESTLTKQITNDAKLYVQQLTAVATMKAAEEMLIDLMKTQLAAQRQLAQPLKIGEVKEPLNWKNVIQKLQVKNWFIYDTKAVETYGQKMETLMDIIVRTSTTIQDLNPDTFIELPTTLEATKKVLNELETKRGFIALQKSTQTTTLDLFVLDSKIGTIKNHLKELESVVPFAGVSGTIKGLQAEITSLVEKRDLVNYMTAGEDAVIALNDEIAKLQEKLDYLSSGQSRKVVEPIPKMTPKPGALTNDAQLEKANNITKQYNKSVEELNAAHTLSIGISKEMGIAFDYNGKKMDLLWNTMVALTDIGIDPTNKALSDLIVEFAKLNDAASVTDKLEKEKQSFLDFRKSIESMLDGFIASTITNVFESIGAALTGGTALEDAFKTIIGSFGNFMVQMGSMMIAYGITQSAFWSSFAEGPLGAIKLIAAGAALALIGGAVSALAKQGPDTANIPKMAKGGIVPKGFPNDTYPALLTSEEMVLPKPIALPMISNLQNKTGTDTMFVEVEVHGAISGQTIQLASDRFMKRKGLVG